MANEIAKLFASLSFKVSDKGLKEFQTKLQETKKQIDSSGGLTGATKKGKQGVSQLYKEIKAGYAKAKPNMDQLHRDIKRVNDAFEAGKITNEEFNDARERLSKRLTQEQNKEAAAFTRRQKEREAFYKKQRAEQEKTAKAQQRVQDNLRKNLMRINKQYDSRSAKLKQVRADFAHINAEYKKGNITLRERERILQGIVAQRRKLMVPADPGPFAGGRDPRQRGTHGLISALHSDAAIASMFGGFAAAGSIQSYQQIVAMEQGLTAASGSSEKAAEDMEYLIGLSRKLGVFVGDLGSSFSNFSAAARGSSLTSEEVRKTFEGVSAQARVLNLSAADTQGVMRSLTQMMN